MYIYPFNSKPVIRNEVPSTNKSRKANYWILFCSPVQPNYSQKSQFLVIYLISNNTLGSLVARQWQLLYKVALIVQDTASQYY